MTICKAGKGLEIWRESLFFINLFFSLYVDPSQILWSVPQPLPRQHWKATSGRIENGQPKGETKHWDLVREWVAQLWMGCIEFGKNKIFLKLSDVIRYLKRKRIWYFKLFTWSKLRQHSFSWNGLEELKVLRKKYQKLLILEFIYWN